MSDYIIVIATVIVVPILFGWIRGKNNVNPFTVRGREYYDS